MKRWTMKELNEISDRKFLVVELIERRKKCTNAYSPLHRHLNALIERLEYAEKFDVSGNLENTRALMAPERR